MKEEIIPIRNYLKINEKEAALEIEAALQNTCMSLFFNEVATVNLLKRDYLLLLSCEFEAAPGGVL